MPKQFQHLPPLSTLVAFEAAFRLQSFTRAAEELSLSQASVSRRVRELEADLGLQLFDRRRHDVQATIDGEKFAATVRLALNEISTSAEGLRKREADLNRFTIFSDLSLANSIIAPVIGEFQRLHPSLQLRVLSTSEPIEAFDDEFDIGFQYGRWGERKFAIEPIADDVIFPVCSPELFNRFPDTIDLAEIAAQPLLHFYDPNRDWPSWSDFFTAFGVENPQPVMGLTFSSYQVCMDVAESGEGIALGWGRTVKGRLEDGHLIRISNMTLPLAEGINAHLPRTGEPNPKVDQFLQMLRSSVEPHELPQEELEERDAKRDLGSELLESVRQMKADQNARVHNIEVADIVEARQKVGLSQDQFALLLGVSKQTLQDWEQGRREPSGAAKSLVAIAIKRPDVLLEAFGKVA